MSGLRSPSHLLPLLWLSSLTSGTPRMVQQRSTHGRGFDLSPDGQAFAVAELNGRARVFSTATGEPLSPPLGRAAITLRFAAGGKPVFGADSMDGAWPIYQTRARADFVDVSPDGMAFATGETDADDRTAMVWKP